VFEHGIENSVHIAEVVVDAHGGNAGFGGESTNGDRFGSVGTNDP
jgi:ribulose kinase